MGKFIAILVLGVALFFSGAYALGLFDKTKTETPKEVVQEVPVKAKDALGEDLYAPAPFKPIKPLQRRNREPIVILGALNAFETEEVPSQIPGRVLFVGEQVDESAVLVAGSAAFLAEPYYPADPIKTGPEVYVKFYRRIYEGQTVRKGQMLGMVEPAEALANVLKEMAKIAAAEAELEAAAHAEKEGLVRKVRADVSLAKGAINYEEHGSAVLTYQKLKSEAVSAREKVRIAVKDKHIADTKLYQHEIRSVLPYRNFAVKSIQRPAGSQLKQLDPVVLTVQSLERLMAEAQIEEQYAARLEQMKHVTATIEPTISDAPMQTFPGHDGEVNTVAVARDMKILSGGEDKMVYVWKVDVESNLRKLDHDSAVRVLACTSDKAKDNLSVVGCADGSLYLWDLDKDDADPIKPPLIKAHGTGSAITAIAFSPDGKYFASGAADGSICLWTTDEFNLKYKFEATTGVSSKELHEDAVTSLTFTPQCKLISAGRDASLRVWSLKENGAYLDGRPIVNRKGNVHELGVTNDGQWMLYDQGHTLKWYSVEKRNYVYTLNQPAGAMSFDTLAQFSPDGSLLLTGGASEGRLQLWRSPDEDARGFEVRQFATREKAAVSAAAFSPEAGKGGEKSFAVSAAGQKVYVWSIPTGQEVENHRVKNVPLTLKTRTLDPSTRVSRIGFEMQNQFSERYPNGRFEAGRPVTIVID